MVMWTNYFVKLFQYYVFLVSCFSIMASSFNIPCTNTLKRNLKCNVSCYTRQRVNINQPFRTLSHIYCHWLWKHSLNILNIIQLKLLICVRVCMWRIHTIIWWQVYRHTRYTLSNINTFLLAYCYYCFKITSNTDVWNRNSNAMVRLPLNNTGRCFRL
jgi:hypothetical protein